MSFVLWILLALPTPSPGAASTPGRCPAPARAPLPGAGAALTSYAVTCRYECICFRTTGYRCLRTYTERCDGRACWQCQDRVTRKARRSCSIGAPIRSCFCKYQQRPGRGPKAAPAPARRPSVGQSRSARSISAS